MDKVDTLYISDSITPPVVRAFTLFISSPRRDCYHGFCKEGDCVMLYAPVFTWAEIERCRELCHAGQDLDAVRARYKEWGGIPRYVLRKMMDADQEWGDIPR